MKVHHELKSSVIQVQCFGMYQVRYIYIKYVLSSARGRLRYNATSPPDVGQSSNCGATYRSQHCLQIVSIAGGNFATTGCRLDIYIKKN